MRKKEGDLTPIGMSLRRRAKMRVQERRIKEIFEKTRQTKQLKNPNWGGARQGAGRLPLRIRGEGIVLRVNYHCYIDPATWKEIKRLARKESVSEGQVIDMKILGLTREGLKRFLGGVRSLWSAG